MRIAIFSDTFPPDINGVATSTYNLSEALKEHNEEVLVITSNSLNRKKSEYSKSLIRLKGIRLKRLYNYVISWFGNRKTMKILKDFKPDVCHIQTDGPLGQFGFKVAKKTDSALVYTYHTSIEDYTYYVTHGWFFDKSAKAIVKRYVKQKGKKVDALIVPSEKMADYMKSLNIISKVSVVPTGFDFERFKNIDKGKVDELKKRYGISQDDYVILYLGRIAKEKSIDSLLKAFKEYSKGCESKGNTKFLIAGGGPDLPRLKRLAKDLWIGEKVIFTDKVEPTKVPYYYRLGNVYVFASITETQGLTTLEAMASGLPVIVKYDESNKNFIKDGINGFVFQNESEFSHLLDKVRNLDEKEREKMIENGYISLEDYTLESFYYSVIEVYESAIKNNE